MYPQLDSVQKVDIAFYYIIGISIFILIGIVLTMLYFLYKYSRKRNPEPADIKGNLLAEILWTIIPTLIAISMFIVGWDSFRALRSVPENALSVDVEARMWSWKFTYPQGFSSDELYIPLDKPVKLNITSKDVIHSFYAPAYRIKVDAVPGMNTYTWFNPTKEGVFDIYCAEYCGVGHSDMMSKIHVVSSEKYEEFINEKLREEESAVTLPKLLNKYSCTDCHSLDGTVLVGPTLKDIYEKEVTVIENGKEKTVTADKDYLRESILNPSKKVVKGFDAIMSSYKDDMSEDDLEKMISLFAGENVSESKINGRKVAEDSGCFGCHSTDGSVTVGPSFKGMYQSKEVVKRDGKKVEIVVDEQYLRDSIQFPGNDIVEGFDPMMPSYNDLSKEELDALVEYIKNLE
ncbi:MAG TPA: cytochrome c oxidase subunit II [Flexistipes sinusarabici]|uniref:Cytochrome c oxidase subunit 2 n=1 Tax=Flexistipes sinusarabici TaxID=2352 RepID=A0A3D5QB00_FLESI|nr:cytochrome c oxidase subunit II [Flexistipes sinusarabici]